MNRSMQQAVAVGAEGAPYRVHRTRHLVQVVDKDDELVCTIDPRRSLDEQLAIAGAIAAASLNLVRQPAPERRRVIDIARIGPVFGEGGAR